MEKDTPILLVDDSIAMRQTLKSVLLGLGFGNLQTASNGIEALTKIRASVDSEAAFKLIFLDWNMPEMDGFRMLQVCRTELKLQDTAIIMLTAVSDQASIIKALNAGANSYITKPASAETISKKIKQVSAWMEAQKAKA